MTFHAVRFMSRLTVLLMLAAAGPAFAQPKDPAKPAAGRPTEGEGQVDPALKTLNAASGFYNQGQFSFAADEATRFLKEYPKHAGVTQATHILAMSQYRLTRYADAVPLLEQLLKDDKFKTRDEALAVLAHCHIVSKANDKALIALDELLAKHGQSKFAESAMLNKAHVLFLLGRKADALAPCEKFLKDYPQSLFRHNGLLTQAQILFDLDRPADAEKPLKEILEATSNSPHVLNATILLGQCQEAQNKLDAAADSFRAAQKLAPPARQAELHYRLAVVLHNFGKHEDAIKALQTILADHDKSTYAAPARLQLGKTQYDANKVADARKTLTQVVQLDKERADEASYWLAQCDIVEKKFDAAIKALDTLAARKPAAGQVLSNVEEVDFFRAICRMQLEQFEPAATAFAAFRKQFDKSRRVVEATYHQSYCLHRLEKFPESLALCDEVIKAGPSPLLFDAGKLRGENLFLSKQYAEAATQYASLARQATADDAKLQIEVRLAQCAFYGGDYKKAAELLAPLAGNNAVAERADLRRTIFLYGDALLLTEQHKEAIAPLTQYLAIDKGNEEARYKLGLAQLRGGNDAAALAAFAEVMKGKADSLWVQHASLAYGRLTYLAKQPEKAGPALKAVLAAKAAPELAAPAKYYLAWIDFDAKKFDAAAVAFAALVKDHSAHELAAESLFQQGVCLREAGKAEEALAVLNDYLKANPKGKHQFTARQLTGSILGKLGRNDEAAKVLAALAAEKDSRNDAVLYDLAWAHRGKKANDDAIAAYRQLLSEYKDSPDTKLLTASRIELAELLFDKKEFQEAAAMLEAAMLDTSADKKALAGGRYRLGLCYMNLKQPAKAAAAFSAFAKDQPEDELTPAALYQAGEEYRTAGKLEEAEQHFSSLVEKHAKSERAEFGRIRLGETLADAGKFDESAKAYQAFLTAHPASKHLYLALFGLGWANENLKKYEDARNWYVKTIEKTDTVKAAQAQFQIGETWFKEGKFEPAAKELLKVEIVYDYPQWSAMALLEAGKAFEALNKPDDAAAQYGKLMDKYKDSLQAADAQKRLAAIKK